MAWAVVQSKNTSGASVTSGTAALSTTVTRNTLIVIAKTAASTTAVTNITVSTGSATFTKVASVADATQSRNIEVWIAANITGGITPTLTVNFNTTTDPELVVYEGSGGDLTGANDGSTSLVTATNSITASTGAINTTINGDLVVKYLRLAGTSTGVAQSGWTELNPSTAANGAGYTIQGTAGSITGTITQSSSVSMGIIVAFKPFVSGLNPGPGQASMISIY